MEFLIPEEWFVGQPQWVLLLVSAVAIAALDKGADWLVDGASGIAYRVGISKVIVGATIVSLGTTSPECAVSVVAAWSLEELLDWIQTNRYVRQLTCEERAQYGIEMLCE